MSKSNDSQAKALWSKLSDKPMGKWIFSHIVGFQAPYFNTIKPTIVELGPGVAKATILKRRAVTNHIGSVHAIAMCNLAELCGGLATDITVRPQYRWIPKGMTVEYLAKAKTSLRAHAKCPAVDQISETSELLVTVDIFDMGEQQVMRAEITMHVSPYHAS